MECGIALGVGCGYGTVQGCGRVLGIGCGRTLGSGIGCWDGEWENIGSGIGKERVLGWMDV